MKKTTLLSTVVVATLLAGSVTAFAAGPRGGDRGEGPRGPAFEQLDLNGDGSVTQAEIDGQAAARFAAADTNGDGLLSADEMTAAREAQRAAAQERRQAEMIARADTDKDGQLSLAEVEAARPGNDRMATRFIDRFDTDKDGSVSKEEFDTALAEMTERRGNRDGRRGGFFGRGN